MTEHVLKVADPYFDALADGSKTFEVRRNDRAYQRGDTLRLYRIPPAKGYRSEPTHAPGSCEDCDRQWGEPLIFRVGFVYSGDPRFGGVEPGYVVLGLGEPGGQHE